MSTPRTYNVLILCTGNSARSILAEALINHLGKERLCAFSAGSHPAGRVNPFAVELLAEKGLPVADLRSKSWDEFARSGAPKLDFIFTVCDSAAGEVCPVWPGHPAKAHWGIPDPAAAQGTDQDKRQAFASAYRQLEARISRFVALPIGEMDEAALQRELDAIGSIEDSVAA